MSKIHKAFENGTAFIAFVTAGDPNADKTVEYVKTMVGAGADLIEFGIPFSDPIADGPIIQAANLRAFQSGTTVEGVFDMVRRVREFSDIPLVFLTYLNPVFKYGYDKFFAKCAEIGVDGLIIPDLPFEEKSEASEVAKNYDVDIISLIAPTSEDRIKNIAAETGGFIYVVSSMGVTGVRNEITTDIPSIMKAIREVSQTPAAIGFGISTPEQAAAYKNIADGVIVGSAIVKIIAEKGENAAPYLYDYVKKMKDAIRD